MINIDIPGYKILTIEHLVLDYNGTIAIDGQMIEGVEALLSRLAKDVRIHIITADTFGRAQKHLKDIPCSVTILPQNNQTVAKADFVRRLGSEQCVSIGNGRNDRLMLETGAVGIAVVQGEGAAGGTMASADIVCSSIIYALELLIHPVRLKATLRS